LLLLESAVVVVIEVVVVVVVVVVVFSVVVFAVVVQVGDKHFFGVTEKCFDRDVNVRKQSNSIESLTN
jgi:hypothetical protein